jgi:hypothetical protein
MSLRSAAEDEITLTLTLSPFDKAQGRRWNGRGDWFLASYPRPLCGRRQGEGSDFKGVNMLECHRETFFAV